MQLTLSLNSVLRRTDGSQDLANKQFIKTASSWENSPHRLSCVTTVLGEKQSSEFAVSSLRQASVTAWGNVTINRWLEDLKTVLIYLPIAPSQQACARKYQNFTRSSQQRYDTFAPQESSRQHLQSKTRHSEDSRSHPQMTNPIFIFTTYFKAEFY